MMRMVMKMSLWLVLLGLAVTSAAAAAGSGSCVGRCGEVFTRGQQCTCDFSCLQHSECCPDFQATCTSAQSCQGRCGESFRRGQLCECDPQCIHHNTCCPDYQLHCDASVTVSNPGTLQPLRAAASGDQKSKKSKKKSNSESEEQVTGLADTKTRTSTLQDVVQPSGVSVVNAGPQGPGAGLSDSSVGLLPLSVPSSHGGSPDSSAPVPALPSYSLPSQGSGTPVGPSGPGAVGGTVDGHLVLSPEGLTPYGSNQGMAGSRFQPQTQQDLAQHLGLSVVDAGLQGPGAGLFADVELCSEFPMNGLTALINGTILIFKGELFWSVDPVSRLAGPPQSITDTLGVPSPIDTVFTRWNCNRNTYIIKGDQCWSFDGNMAVEPGYPKPLASEFPGLTGPISAAFAAPATRSQPETVYFFKNGDIMQSFTFPPCSTKPRSSLKRRLTRQAVLLGGEINIKVSLKGFPSPVTSALTMPSPQRSDKFYHYVFSGPIFFRVQIGGDLPALAKPDPSAPLAPLPIISPAATVGSSPSMAAQNANPTSLANSIRVWLRCP
ncbi:proteoglycan 4a [Trachinotus anak]|uniref:proteoglycan 4a n=1 Tax=Trachinotus anak TaxID=443729 RepID=UPI0039F246F4